MAGDIRGIVSKRAQGKSVLVGILTLREQLSNEIAAANVVEQIAELHAAKGVIAKVLDYRAAVGVRVRLIELFLRERWKPLEKERTEIRCPHQVHDFFVREYGVC
jgi:hypothetical protein